MEREKTLHHFDEAVMQCERFERKGKTMPYTSANGHMFSLLNKKGELGIRFSKDVQKQYIETWDTGLFYSYGAEMHGYVRVPDFIVENKSELAKYLNEAFDYVNTLPPK